MTAWTTRTHRVLGLVIDKQNAGDLTPFKPWRVAIADVYREAGRYAVVGQAVGLESAVWVVVDSVEEAAREALEIQRHIMQGALMQSLNHVAPVWIVRGTGELVTEVAKRVRIVR